MLSGGYGLSYYGGVVAGLGSYQAFRDCFEGADSTDQFCAVFVLEQTLGHVTHSKNLQSLIPRHEDLTSVFLPIDSSLTGLARHVPGWSNWTVRAGIRARRSLRRLYRSDRHFRADAMFVHSQVPAVLLGRWMRRSRPSCHLDATPEQYDDLGDVLFSRRRASTRRTVQALGEPQVFLACSTSDHLVGVGEAGVWSRATASRPSDVTVIAPGVNIEAWTATFGPSRARGAHSHPLRRGDAKRKGGELLIEAARRLRTMDGIPAFEVHMVTASDLPAEAGLFVHAGLSANSPELIEQYQLGRHLLLADVRRLPSDGACRSGRGRVSRWFRPMSVPSASWSVTVRPDA